MKTEFGSLISVESQKAADFTCALNAFIQTEGIDRSKIVRVAADGCSTIMGEYQGVATSLARGISHAVAINSVTHRFVEYCYFY